MIIKSHDDRYLPFTVSETNKENFKKNKTKFKQLFFPCKIKFKIKIRFTPGQTPIRKISK